MFSNFHHMQGSLGRDLNKWKLNKQRLKNCMAKITTKNLMKKIIFSANWIICKTFGKFEMFSYSSCKLKIHPFKLQLNVFGYRMNRFMFNTAYGRLKVQQSIESKIGNNSILISIFSFPSPICRIKRMELFIQST